DLGGFGGQGLQVGGARANLHCRQVGDDLVGDAGGSSSQGGGIALGFLLGSRRYSSARSSFPSGSRLRVQARCELLGDNGLGMFACRILAGEDEWATANVSVFEPADAMAYLESGQA
ncbi:ApeP family dehydratase, partial [Escherichia coli]